MQKKRGGSRKGAGRKKKYHEKTKHVTFVIPVSAIDTVKVIVCEYLKQYQNATT